MLCGKNVLVGVTGSIAAYKSAHLIRLLIKAGAHVKVVMTPASFDFITPLTLSTLSKNPVYSNFTESKEAGTWNNHVEMGLWADLMLIAPVSANTLGKMANGICDNFLMATYLSAKCDVFFAPSMDLDMYKHESTKENIAKLEERGNIFIKAGFGELASGLVGEGRMAEPEEILEQVENYLKKNLPLAGQKWLVSAGPTYEAIDPVRFVGNHSSGKMGIAIADAAAALGAEVVLVCGPSSIKCSNKLVNRFDVVSAEEMKARLEEHYNDANVTIMSAAVADYRPKKVASQKLKKKEDQLDIQMEPTPDILKGLGENKNKDQILVGFALETENEISNAQGKLRRKNLDFIVLNSLKDKGAGFGTDTNLVKFIDRNNNIDSFELKSKKEVATDIINKIRTLQ